MTISRLGRSFGRGTKKGGLYYVDDVGGVTERKNGQILAAAYVLLLGESVPKRFWMDVVNYGVYLLNRLPSRVLDVQTPVQKGYRFYHTATRCLYKHVTFIEDEMLSPECKAFVTRMDSIKIPTRVEEAFNTTLRQFDVKNEFLYGELEEEVYMSLSPDYSVTGNMRNVCILKKALYGLKQSPWAWYRYEKLGYQRANTDHTLFIKHRVGKVTLLMIYVDDMIVTSDDTIEIEELQKGLASEFQMKDLGSQKYFLEVEVTRSKHGLFLSQMKHVMGQRANTGMFDCKPVPTNKERYQRLVERFIYLSLTCPNIAYMVSDASQFMHSPSKDHMVALMRIPIYLKSAPGRDLLFKKNSHLDLEGYTDANYAGNITNIHSTLGYFTFVGSNLVTWHSKKQNVVFRSSTESEYRGFSQGICEILWLRWLLAEIGFRPDAATKLHCDSRSGFEIVNNLVQHD
ncbi:hypothetical protein Prudu_021956 [Prunus dulcis]|uniref:Reverse transcriptase Ty1/copia-type domain-containing protein n=1 Tax=Prunus dulcis TaxID=3755 RepID=A0A4Y1S061_PRUDU|nr:hypothetical protein Prudu_021956 [Prunus dulcis]